MKTQINTAQLEAAKKEILMSGDMAGKAKNVMYMAWYCAKAMAKKYGVSSKALLPTALKRAWAGVKAKISIFDAYEHRQTLAKIGFEFNKETKAWEKVMLIREFKNRTPVKYGRGFITFNALDAAYSHKHSIKFI